MQTRKLGKNGPEVSAVGLGCMPMSEFYGGYDDRQSIRTIQHAVDSGMTFLDTADMYGQGHNEQLVGRALREGGRRERAVVATKFGIRRDESGQMIGVSGKPEYVREACEASLRRLGIETIDLYYQHRVDPETPIEETVGAMSELVREGKVRFLGLSEAAAATVRRACSVHPIAALQTEYSLWSRDPEEEILPACRELGVGFVAYSPLGRGFLTGQIKSPEDLEPDDWRRQNPRFQGDNFQKNLELVRGVELLAKEKGVTPAQLAIAWLLHQGDDVVPIPGTRKERRIDENGAAAGIELSQADLDRLDSIAPRGAAAGTRYPEGGMKAVNR